MNGNVIGQVAPDANMIGKPVYGPNGELLGYVGEDGLVRDANGNIIGRVLADGRVVDMNGNVIGQVEPPANMIGKPVYGPDGKLLGYVGKDGYVRDANGNIIGRVLPDGTVVDMNGNPIGKVDAASDKVRVAIGRDGKFLGVVGPDGYLRDANGNIIGRVLPDGTVVDLNGNVIGSVLEGEPLRDADGNIIGIILPDGRVMDLNGVEIGRLDADGNIVDADGNILGTWRGGKLTVKSDKLRPRFAFDKNGKKIGIILADGTVVDADGNIIGVVNENGDILDANGNIIGSDRNPDQAGGDDDRKGEKGGKRDVSVMGRFDPDAYGQYRGKNLGAGGGTGRGERYDPVRMAKLQAMQTARRRTMTMGMLGTVKSAKQMEQERLAMQKKSANWESQSVQRSVSSYRVDMDRVILADKAIPAVLVRSLDSRYPEVPASAIVERNIYSESGRKIIIPAGSRLIGEMSPGGEGNEGATATKMNVSWKRLIRPDGAAFFFADDGVSGDAQGRGGVSAYLDLQMIKRFGIPTLQTVIESAVLYLSASNDKPTLSSDGEVALSERQEAAQDARTKFSDNMNNMFQTVLKDLGKLSPVVYVPSGTRITVFAKTDLWLRSEQDPPESSAGKADTLIDNHDDKEGGLTGDSEGGGAEGGGGNPNDPDAPPPAAFSPDQVQQQQQVYYGPGGAYMPGAPQQQKGSSLIGGNPQPQQPYPPYGAYPPYAYPPQQAPQQQRRAAPAAQPAQLPASETKEEDPVPELF